MATTRNSARVAGATIPVFTSPRGEADVMRAYQTVMDAWPVEYDELTIATSFGGTHVIASGPRNAPPLVLIHALFATAAAWYRNVETLSSSHRTYCVDVIGEANKSRPSRPIASMDDFLQWFTELIDGLGIDTLCLVGNSYGGFTGAYYAMKLPERVHKLVLIGPASTIHSMNPFMWRMFLPKGIYQTAPWLPGLERTMRSSVDWMHAGLAPDPVWEPLFYESMKHGRLINRVFPRVFSKDELATIQAPVLLVLGQKEVIYGDVRSAIEAGRELMPDAKVALIPRAHHITAVAQPELVNEQLMRFFADAPIEHLSVE
jgi:pimeloyl-ACP methyl ester carboxylesterase